MMCNNTYNSCCNSNPCNCNSKQTTTTSTTMPIVECDVINCEEVITTDCVTYSISSECLSIKNWNSFNDVIKILFEKVTGYNCSCDFNQAIVEKVQNITTTTSTSTSTSTTSTSTTTSTTTQFLPSSMCFSFDGESYGPYICTLQPEPTLYNFKPYYKVLEDDCTTPWQTGIVYIYFNTAPGIYQNKWVMGILGDANNIIQYLDSNIPPTYPIGNVDLTTPLSPPNNSGLWKIGNVNIDQVLITSSLLECPEPVDICFTYNGEAIGGAVQCTQSSEPGLVNGKLYYKALLSDCTTQYDNYYIWFSTSGTYTNQWVMSPLSSANPLDYVAYLPVSSSPDYPIGTWTVTNLAGPLFVTDSSFSCETFCFKSILEIGTPYSITPVAEPTLFNGKSWYKNVTPLAKLIYWSNNLNKWVVSASSTSSPSTPDVAVVQTLDNNGGNLPISNALYQWQPEPHPTNDYTCGPLSIGYVICESPAGNCETTPITNVIE